MLKALSLGLFKKAAMDFFFFFFAFTTFMNIDEASSIKPVQRLHTPFLSLSLFFVQRSKNAFQLVLIVLGIFNSKDRMVEKKIRAFMQNSCAKNICHLLVLFVKAIESFKVNVAI